MLWRAGLPCLEVPPAFLYRPSESPQIIARGQIGRMSRPRLLLVPSFTELKWGVLPLLEEWADVATFDMPGVGEQPADEELVPQPGGSAALLRPPERAVAPLTA